MADSLVRTYDLDGFCKSLELVLDLARRGRLVSVSINLEPNGLGHYAYKLVDGTALPGLTELDAVPRRVDGEPETGPTAPGKGQGRKDSGGR